MSDSSQRSRKPDFKKSVSTAYLRLATDTSRLSLLAVPTFENNDAGHDAKTYCNSLRQSDDFVDAHAVHMSKHSEASQEADCWIHACSVKWDNERNYADGVRICFKSKRDTEVLETEAFYIKPISELFQEHLTYHSGTQEIIEYDFSRWEEALDTIENTLWMYGLKQPFSGTSNFTGHVKPINSEIMVSQSVSVHIDLPKTSEGTALPPLRYTFDQDGLKQLVPEAISG